MSKKSFLGRLNLFTLTDYKIQSNRVYFGILISQMLVAYVLLLAEILVDLQSSTVETFAAYALAVTLISILGFSYPNKNWIRGAVPVFIYLLCEYIFLALPKTYTFMVYWFPLIPVVALIIQGLKRSQIWALIILITQFANFFYLEDQIGQTYLMEVRGLSSLWSGTIFIITILSSLYFLYILLGEAYTDSRKKNAELSLLKTQIQEMNEELFEINKRLTSSNESLEEKVRFRTQELETQNSQLKKYAFANSHLLRAPLSNVLGLTDIISQSLEPGKENEVALALRKAALDLDTVVKNINRDLESGDMNMDERVS
ncbi:MAG: hypothetical protein ABJF11_08215 [Reichenbachiella sp.]|uniref:hypothetical protein n=1 Tax=Reichenbachiella sp. TaxID=2184521 RepID=UPI0032630689